MAKTLQEKYSDALKALGETEIKKLTGCIVFTRKEGGFYYVGKSGSLRVGTTRATSIPVSKKFKLGFLENVL